MSACLSGSSGKENACERVGDRVGETRERTECGTECERELEEKCGMEWEKGDENKWEVERKCSESV